MLLAKELMLTLSTPIQVSEKKWDAIVIGAGISGLTVAKMLKEKGQSVLIMEREQTSGGLIRCTREQENILYHRVGGHVFNTRIPRVAEWFWAQFNRNKEFLHANRKAMISYDFKHNFSYPIESHLYEYGPEFCAKALEDMTRAQFSDKAIDSSNFGQYLRSIFGEKLYEHYFRPYNEKIWKRDLQTIGVDWLDGKLPQPKVIDAVISNIFRKENDTMAHATFFYPEVNGSQFLVDQLSIGLTINTLTAVHSISVDQNDIVVNGAYRCRQLIYTGDLRALPAQLSGVFITDRLRDAITDLPSNGTSSALCKTSKLPYSWLYVPSPEFKFHRIIHTGGFSPTNNGKLDKIKQSSCVVEFSGYFSQEEMATEINGAEIGLEPIAFNYAKNSYVIHRQDTAVVVEEARRILANHGIYLLGRFAEWQYYNMDNAIDAAMRLVNQLQIRTP